MKIGRRKEKHNHDYDDELLWENFWQMKGVKHSQPAFTYSELTVETLEHGVKYVQSQQKRHQNGANDIEQILHLVLVFLLLSLNVWLSAELLPKVLTTANHWHAAIKSSNFIKLSYAVVITTIKFHKKSQSYIQSQNCYTWFSKSTLTIWAI